MEREMALASSAVLRGKRLVASRDVMADSCGKTQIAARVVALNRPNRQTERARGSYRRAEVKWKPASPGTGLIPRYGGDRKSVIEGKRVVERVALAVRRLPLKKQKTESVGYSK